MSARTAVFVDRAHLGQSLANIKQESEAIKVLIKENQQKIQVLLSTTFGDKGRSLAQTAMGAAKMVRAVSIKDAVYALLAPFPKDFYIESSAHRRTDHRALEEQQLSTWYIKRDSNISKKFFMKGKELDQKENPSQEEIQELHELFLATRAYRPDQSPEFLVFEDAFGHFLRPQQIEILGRLFVREMSVLNQR